MSEINALANNHCRLRAVALLAFLSLSAPFAVHADDSLHFYGGFGEGAATSDAGLTELHLLAGMQIQPQIAVELSTFKLHARTGNADFILDEARIYNLDAIVQTPEFAHITAFGSLGLAQTRYHGSLAAPGGHATGLGYGVGLQSTLFTRIQVRLEWQQLNTAAPAALRPTLISLSLGLRF
jgi:hypothetical protein